MLSAARILTLNGVENAKVVNEYSYEYNPEDGDLADIIVSEILDCCAFGEGVIPAFLDAHLRLANNVARFIPSDASLFATLLESPSVYLNHSFTSASGKEFRSEYVQCGNEESKEPYWCTRVSDLPDAKHLSSSHQVVRVDFQNVNELHRYINGVSGVLKVVEGETVVLKWTLKRNRFDICVDVTDRTGDTRRDRELIVRDQLDFRTMNNDMLLFAISRLLPSVSKYSWNLDAELSDEEAGVVRSLPHFLVDAKDIDRAAEGEVDEGYTDQYVVVWPIRGDGSVSEVFLNVLRSLRLKTDIPPSLKHCGFLTDRLAAHGVLVSSERLSKLTRVQQSSLCGAELAPVQMFTLLEYRDIEIFPQRDRPHHLRVWEDTAIDYIDEEYDLFVHYLRDCAREGET
ncbi:unnamed protein product [Heligmosomoides polygyrus]|uniref:RNA-directed RNA polymerase n=1 Tax=Heligmosomoides polygyrus TaxID=6339 RepID=A0A183FW19_HELPZ|nr:unnamed protein product [Heligmosomoides polygyrus]